MSEKWEYLSEFICVVPTQKDMFESVEDTSKGRGNHPPSERLCLWQLGLEKELDAFGEKGWELVTIEPKLITGVSNSGYALFKRKR